MKIRKICLVGMLVALLIGSLTVDSVYAFGTLPDIWTWMGSWFKLTIIQKDYHFDSQGVIPRPVRQVPSSGPAYLYINHGWWGSGPPEYQGIGGPLYTLNSEGTWDRTSYLTLNFDYFAGSDLRFVASAVFGNANTKFGATLLFNGRRDKNGAFVNSFTTINSLGGYITEIDDVPGSTERWAGSLRLVGKRIDRSKLPPELSSIWGITSFEETTETTPEGTIIHRLLPMP